MITRLLCHFYLQETTPNGVSLRLEMNPICRWYYLERFLYIGCLKLWS